MEKKTKLKTIKEQPMIYNNYHYHYDDKLNENTVIIDTQDIGMIQIKSPEPLDYVMKKAKELVDLAKKQNRSDKNAH